VGFGIPAKKGAGCEIFCVPAGAGFHNFNKWDLGFRQIFIGMQDILFIGSITSE